MAALSAILIVAEGTRDTLGNPPPSPEILKYYFSSGEARH